MKRIRRFVVIMAVMCYAATAFAQSVTADSIINRRDQARGAFLTTPQGIYQHYCGHCHGEDGKGGGRLWASELSPKPADLTVTKLEQEALVKFITAGSAAAGKSNLCPPWGQTISPANVTRLVRYILALGEETALSGPLPSESAAQLRPASEPFPWLWVVILVAEAVGLALLFQRMRRRSP